MVSSHLRFPIETKHKHWAGPNKDHLRYISFYKLHVYISIIIVNLWFLNPSPVIETFFNKKQQRMHYISLVRLFDFLVGTHTRISHCLCWHNIAQLLLCHVCEANIKERCGRSTVKNMSLIFLTLLAQCTNLFFMKLLESTKVACSKGLSQLEHNWHMSTIGQ